MSPSPLIANAQYVSADVIRKGDKERGIKGETGKGSGEGRREGYVGANGEGGQPAKVKGGAL